MLRLRGVLGVVSVLVAIAATGCGDGEDGDGGPVTAPSFATELPSGWSEGDDDDLEFTEESAKQGAASALGVSADELSIEAEAVWFGPETEDGFKTNVNVLAEAIPPSLDEAAYIEASLGNLEGIPGVEEFERRAGPDLGGEETEEIEYSSLAQGETLRFRALTLVRDETGFTVTLTASEDAFEEASADLDEITASWEWED
ncbi:MAG: DUF1795 domain-containing protein [Actinomycetota bacterium]|nr:DUF1795 domain-containing protein [Actinomycetota bacterium]